MAQKRTRAIKDKEVVIDEPRQDVLSHEEEVCLNAAEIADLNNTIVEQRLLQKDREIICCKIETKKLEKTVKELELQIMGNQLSQKDMEINTIKQNRVQILNNIKEKYHIEGSFGFNPDTGAINKE